MAKTKVSKANNSRWLGLAGLVLTGSLIWLSFPKWHEPPAMPAAPSAQVATQAAVASPPPVAANQPALRPSASQPLANFAWFQPHPFKVALTNGAYEWTAEDGKDPEVIQRLAHNELESQRMLRENDTIYRRQLVYDTAGFQRLAQQAVQSGQSIQQVTLPGLDGQQFQVVVTRTELKSGGEQGQFYGQLPGQPNSLVTLAFLAGREAFTIISPQDQTYLQAESREPGEVVVKSINPATYGMVK